MNESSCYTLSLAALVNPPTFSLHPYRLFHLVMGRVTRGVWAGVYIALRTALRVSVSFCVICLLIVNRSEKVRTSTCTVLGHDNY
ncbi:hypothetical protein BGW80DRAFT_1378797 [Lactifluus volemus]|nr:hypothetical protein BGW80DRAFT_1378797 [Lactifluus volemus]